MDEEPIQFLRSFGFQRPDRDIEILDRARDAWTRDVRPIVTRRAMLIMVAASISLLIDLELTVSQTRSDTSSVRDPERREQLTTVIHAGLSDHTITTTVPHPFDLLRISMRNRLLENMP